MKSFVSILRKYTVAMVMNFIGLEFVAAFAAIGLLTLAIVAIMSWRAVRANPVNTLRKE